jgi:hypothetical protein
MNVTIVTSIAPFSLGKQKYAISTWMDAGFTVVSINVPEELAVLEKEFPGVRFVEAVRDAGARHGKPLIYINDALKVLTEVGGDVCGIVNADIALKVGTPDGFHKFIAETAAGAFVFGARIDIDSISELNGKEYERGFDFFFFDRRIISCYESASFCFGAPWWDYWFPLTAFLKGLPVKRLISPVAFHTIHGDRWRSEDFESYGLELLTYLQRNVPRRPSDGIAVSELRLVLQDKDVLQVAKTICLYLRYHVEPVFFNDVHPGIERVALSSQQYGDVSDKLKILGALCSKHQANEKDILDELTRCRHMLASIEGSKCWRLTKPLRWALDMLHPSSEK